MVDFCCMKRQQRDEKDQARVFEFPDFIRAFKVRSKTSDQLKILSKIGYQEVNETDDGRFKIIS